MKFLVKEVVEFSRIIEANTKEEALEFFGNNDADTRLIKITAVSLNRAERQRVSRPGQGERK